MRPAVTAFVLTGGGSLGAVQVGMLQALHYGGVIPDMIVGASVGAINAALYAASPDEDGLEALALLWRGLHRRDIFPLSLARAAWCLTGRSDSWIAPAALRKLIDSAIDSTFAGRDLEDARLPVHVLATDALDGTSIVLSSGDAAAALMASAAIPGVFPFVSIDGRALIDGVFATETPIACAVRLGANHLIVLPTGTSCALCEPPRGAVASALHAMNLLSMRQLLGDIDRWANRCSLSVVPPLCPISVQPYDFSHGAQLMDRAEESTRQWLRQEATSIDPKWALLPHRHVCTARRPAVDFSPSLLRGASPRHFRDTPAKRSRELAPPPTEWRKTS